MNTDTIPVIPPSSVAKNRFANSSFSSNELAHHSSSSRTRILIVEENCEMRAHFKQFLGSEFDLIIVASPEEALSAACIGHFDIVIQDIEHEKEFEAVSLSKQLSRLHHCKHAYFLSITGYVLPEGKSILKRGNYDYHLAKPFTLRRLRDLLRLCVAKQTISILNGINVELDLPMGTTMALMVEV